MNEYGAVENQMDGMIRDIEELRAENEKLKAENKKLKNYRVFIPKPIDFSGDGLLFAPEGLKQLYNGEEVEKIVKEREDYKHRAEVAEKALLSLCDRTMENCLVIVFKSTNTQVWNKQELCDYYIKQAEKELSEEEKE